MDTSLRESAVSRMFLAVVSKIEQRSAWAGRDAAAEETHAQVTRQSPDIFGLLEAASMIPARHQRIRHCFKNQEAQQADH